jgi:hypothetical protein
MAASAVLDTAFLGTGIGDRFKAFQGGSRRFEERCGGHEN